MIQFQSFVLFILLGTSLYLSTSGVQAQVVLQANITSARLPQPIGANSAVYDGDDSIYIRWYNLVYKYSVTNDSIEEIGAIPEDGSNRPLFLRREDNSLIAYTLHDRIFEFNTFTRQVSKELPCIPYVAYRGIGGGQINATHAAIIWGYHQPVIEGTFQVMYLYDLETGVISNRRPFYHSWWLEEDVAVVPRGNDLVLIFQRYGYWEDETQLLTWNITSNTHVESTLATGALTGFPAVVDAEGYAWIVGGIGGSGSAQPSNGIFRYVPGQNLEFVLVPGFPSSRNSEYHWVSGVYVEKLRRIYTFGGARDEIWYIQLE